MASFSLLGAVLDLVGLASTITVIVWLVSGLQPLFERVRDSCRACQPPEGRAQLLWSAFLIQVAWVAAAALYFRILSSLWDYMGTWLENRPVNRPVYALLHLYLYFLLLCGIYAWATTMVEIFQNRKVLSDLVMIARFNTGRYQVIEDAEAQHHSSSLATVDFGTETPSVVGNVRNIRSLPRDESLNRNGQKSTEDIAPAEAHINEPEHPPGEPTSSKIDHPVGGIVAWADHSRIRNSNVNIPSWTIGGVRNSSEAAGSSIQCQVIVDSDGDTITATPSSSSSSSSSSGIDELEYVDDDNDGCGLQGVRLREHLEAREQMNTNGLHVVVINQRGWVKRDNDDDPHRLYNATPRLKPQDQNAKIDLEPLDIGEPLSPCDSCSSAHAESIPTAKRSPARVPITPTSPTADAEDADTEKTDVERKTRDRKHRNSALSAPQRPAQQRPAQQRPCDFEEDTWGLRSNLAAYAREQRARTAASKHASSQPKPKAFPAAAYDTPDASPPPEFGDRETGLFWRSREVDDDGSPASGDEIASTIPSDDDEHFMFSRRSVGPAPTTSPPRRRPGSPYPFTGGRQAGGAEGGKNTMGLSIDIPSVALDSYDEESKQ